MNKSESETDQNADSVLTSDFQTLDRNSDSHAWINFIYLSIIKEFEAKGLKDKNLISSKSMNTIWFINNNEIPDRSKQIFVKIIKNLEQENQTITVADFVQQISYELYNCQKNIEMHKMKKIQCLEINIEARKLNSQNQLPNDKKLSAQNLIMLKLLSVYSLPANTKFYSTISLDQAIVMKTNEIKGQGQNSKTQFREGENIFIFEFKDQVVSMTFHFYNSNKKQLYAVSQMQMNCFFDNLEIHDLQGQKSKEFEVALDLKTPNLQTTIGKIELQMQVQLTLIMKGLLLDRKVEISDKIINKVAIDINNQKLLIKDLLRPFDCLSFVEKLGFVNKKQEEQNEERNCRMCTTGVESCKLF